MTDLAARLSSEEMAELCALVDGSLPEERRAEVEARVAASPELQKVVERQRQAVLAARALAAEDVPASLLAAVEAHRREAVGRRRRGMRLVPRLALVTAGAVATIVVAAVVLSGGPGAPTVADAARLATQSPTGPPPGPAGTSKTRLAVYVQGVAFPDLAQYGWHPLGIRRGHVDGRDATVVFYGKNGRRLGYVIVAGAGLSRPSGAQSKNVRGVQYQMLVAKSRLAVTWRRGGHTCVLLGQATRAELLKLASWPLSSRR